MNSFGSGDGHFSWATSADDERRAATPVAEGPGRPPLRWQTPEGEPAARRCLLISPCGVLFDDSVWSRWLLQLLARMGLHTHSQAFLEVWRRDFFEDVCFARRDHWEALQAMLIASGLSRGQADEVCAAARPRWRQWQASLHAYPRVAGTLSALSAAGVSLGIAACSPISAAVLMEHLERNDLAHWFDFVLTSHDDGVAGSLASLYERAAQHWNATDECVTMKLITGHSSELEAARLARLNVIAAYGHAPAEVPAIERFDQLTALIALSERHALAS